MSRGGFAGQALLTLSARVLKLVLGLGVSVILARGLGVEGRGIYALALLLPSIIVVFANAGIGRAAAFFVARGEFRRQEILGNNVLLAMATAGLGVLAGALVVSFLRHSIFPGVSPGLLLLAITLVVPMILSRLFENVLLGAQHIWQFNFVTVVHSLISLVCLVVALLVIRAGVSGALVAGLLAWLPVNALAFRWAREAAGGAEFVPNWSLIRRGIGYGLPANAVYVLEFLNWRVDMLLINAFLEPAAVGAYAIGVGLVEKIWLVSQSAGSVLFPRVAAEKDEQRRKHFTPLVARAVLMTAGLTALVLALLSHWIILVLYSEAFVLAVGAVRGMLVGVVALSAGRVLAKDIAGRGLPRLNVYAGMVAVMVNIVANIMWIPRYGIVGAAWASTASYTASYVVTLHFYCRVSGNRWWKLVVPQRKDLGLYMHVAKNLLRGLKGLVLR